MNLKNLYIFVAAVGLVFFCFSCGTTGTDGKDGKSKKKQQEEEVKRTLVEDPDGVVLKINGKPVNKGELDKQIEIQKPTESTIYYMVIFKYFFPEICSKGLFEKEKPKLLDEVNGIMEKVKSDEITFEDAIVNYCDFEGKKNTKGFNSKMGPSLFYTIDKAVLSTEEGKISEPFFTPYGINVVKVEKIHKDYYDEPYAADYYHFLITFNKFMEEGKDVYSNLSDLMTKAKIKILNDSFAKDFKELYVWGMQGEEAQEAIKKLEEIPEPEQDWKTVPPETVLLQINDVKITKKELDDIRSEIFFPMREVYNAVIQGYFLPKLAIQGHFQEYEDDILKKLNNLKSKIEKGEIKFEDAQQQFSDDPGKTQGDGVYREVERNSFVPEFEEVMFGLPLNTVSEPFFSQYGGHIVRVEKEELDADGNREKVDVRHILIGYSNYLTKESKEDPYYERDPFSMVQSEAMKDLNVVIYDEYLYSILPDLGKPAHYSAGIPAPIEEIEESEKQGE